MNKNNSLKKKDMIVILVNLLVLFLVIYIFYIVENLKIVFSNESLCVLKTSSKTDLTEDYTDEINLSSFKIASHNPKIRHVRSTNSVKCNFI